MAVDSGVGVEWVLFLAGFVLVGGAAVDLFPPAVRGVALFVLGMASGVALYKLGTDDVGDAVDVRRG
jgi:hypothetical protein